MQLANTDWTIIAAFFSISLILVLWVSHRAESKASEFFLSLRNMPWWLLGVSMMATTFSEPLQISGMLVGCVTEYGDLFTTGSFIYGNTGLSIVLSALAIVGSTAIFTFRKRLNTLIK